MIRLPNFLYKEMKKEKKLLPLKVLKFNDEFIVNGLRYCINKFIGKFVSCVVLNGKTKRGLKNFKLFNKFDFVEYVK